MKSIKKSFLVFLICLFSTTSCFGGVFGWIKEIFSGHYRPAGTAAVKKAGEVLETNLPKVKDAAAGIGIDAVKVLKPVAWVVAGAYALGKAGETVKDLKSLVYPSNEEAAKDAACALAYKRFVAADKLRVSLMKNAYSRRGALGIPIECEKDAQELVKADGCAELKKAIEDFKFLYGKSSC